MKRPKPNGPALLAEVLIALGARKVYERYIPCDDSFVHGLTDGQTIIVNPAHEVVDTILHETLHTIRPDWSEAYVRNRTTWLMRRMPDEQILQVYQEYQKRAKRPK